MAFGEPGFRSCTPGGILRLLEAYDVPLAGAHAVVIGRSPILGKPVGIEGVELLKAHRCLMQTLFQHFLDAGLQLPVIEVKQ